MDLMIIANIAKKMEKTKNTAIFVYTIFLLSYYSSPPS